MTNNLAFYNPEFYAQNALISLENTLGAVGRLHRGYENERNAFGRGDTINISRPGTFTVQDAPSTAQDLNPDSLTMVLDQWKEVKFNLNDKEMAFTSRRMIDDHIAPAAYEIADYLETQFYATYTDIPWYHDVTTAAVTDLNAINRVMFDNKVPRRVFKNAAWSSKMEEQLMNLAIMHQADAGGKAGENQRDDGFLGRSFGMDHFASQNVPTHSPGTLVNTAGALLVGAHAKGLTSVNIDDATALTGDLKAGDILTFAGSTQQYAVTADVTAAANAATVAITPALVIAYADNAAVTIDQEATKTTQSVIFHPNYASLVMVPLTTVGEEFGGGVKVATVTNPDTGISIRARIWYDADNSKVVVALDILFGLKVLDPNLAVRVRQA